MHRYSWFGFCKGLLGSTLITFALVQCSGAPEATQSQDGLLPITLPSVQAAYLKPLQSNGIVNFGQTLAFDQNTLVVGATSEDTAPVVNGEIRYDQEPFDSGVVYVFIKSADSWQLQERIHPLIAHNFGKFGDQVVLDDDTLVVGSNGDTSQATTVGGDPNATDVASSGALHIFVRDGEIWSQQAFLDTTTTETAELLVEGLALSGDTLAMVGMRQQQKGVLVFTRTAETWNLQTFIPISNTRYNNRLALQADTLVLSAPEDDQAGRNSGAVYVFQREGETWTQQAFLQASDLQPKAEFGSSIAFQGDTLLIAGWQEDSAATDINRDQQATSAQVSEVVYVFEREGETWTQQAYLKASNSELGDKFGSSLALYGDMIAVGAPRERSRAQGFNGEQQDNSSPLPSGAVYLFTRNNDSWQQHAYIKPSNTFIGEFFGTSVTLSNNSLFVGAPNEGSPGQGINPDQKQPGAIGSGAVYIFE